MQILPIKELKNTAKISQLCNTDNQPIFITKNGYSDLVVMSMKTYEEQQGAFIALSRLLDDNDKTVDGKTAMEQLRRIYE